MKESKKLAKMARERLIVNAGFKSDPNGSTSYYLNNRRITSEEIDNMRTKIREIAASDEVVIDPLNKLIFDGKTFQTLDESGKLRYMLDLSKIYIALSNAI